MAQLPSTTNKVVKIKVHKNTASGENVSNKLRFAENIRIRHSNALIDYKITSRVDSGDFWTFNVIPVPQKIGTPTLSASVVIEPGFSTDIKNSDYLALDNNVEEGSTYAFRQVVDYTTDRDQPINLQAILLNGAEKAQVQEYNYSSKGIVRGRYEGKQLQGTRINEYVAGDISIGRVPVVENLSSFIIEFEWGGGASPEFFGAGGLYVNNIYLIGPNKDSVEVVRKNDAEFGEILKQAIPANENVSIFQYTTDGQVPPYMEVVSSEISVPPISSYIVPSASVASPGVGYITGSDVLVLNGTNVWGVELDTPGYYMTGSSITTEEVYTFLQSELDRGHRVFISFYSLMGTSITYEGNGRIEPIRFNTTVSTTSPAGRLVDPLGAFGVREVLSIDIPFYVGSLVMHLNLNKPVSGSGAPSAQIKDFDHATPDYIGTQVGILIWTSNQEGIVIRDSTLKGVGKGALVGRYSTKTVRDHQEYITATYGGRNR